MSNTNKPASSKAAKKLSSHLEHMAKIAKAKAKESVAAKVVAVLLFALTFAFSCGWFGAAFGASTAILYIFAFDGKVSGRMDGNVLMRNGRGRGFVVPSLVQNGYTAGVRSLLAQLSQGFRGLTQAQIAAWNSFEMTVSNRFGQSKIIKGKACYVRLNANLINVGGTPISDPPVLEDVAGITSLSFTATAPNTMPLTFSPTPTDANVAHLVFATANLSPGISRPSKSAFRLIDVIAGGTATGVAEGANFVTKFGSLVAGDKVFVKLVPVNFTTGQAGVGIIASAVVV